jgi:hypothetical protein
VRGGLGEDCDGSGMVFALALALALTERRRVWNGLTVDCVFHCHISS